MVFSLTEQLFNVPTIIALVLAGILFICAVIILLVSLHLKRRWYGTAKKQNTDSGANDSPYSAENTDNTIIMEEILQEFGHTISSNANHTQWSMDLCLKILQMLKLAPETSANVSAQYSLWNAPVVRHGSCIKRSIHLARWSFSDL